MLCWRTSSFFFRAAISSSFFFRSFCKSRTRFSKLCDTSLYCSSCKQIQKQISDLNASWWKEGSKEIMNIELSYGTLCFRNDTNEGYALQSVPLIDNVRKTDSNSGIHNSVTVNNLDPFSWNSWTLHSTLNWLKTNGLPLFIH